LLFLVDRLLSDNLFVSCCLFDSLAFISSSFFAYNREEFLKPDEFTLAGRWFCLAELGLDLGAVLRFWRFIYGIPLLD